MICSSRPGEDARTAIATSPRVPAGDVRPPTPAYSPSVFSRTTTQSRSGLAALRNGLGTPGKNSTDAGSPTGRSPGKWAAAAPTASLIGHARPADRAEEMASKASSSRDRPRPSSSRLLGVVGRTPGELLPVECEAAARVRRREPPERFARSRRPRSPTPSAGIAATRNTRDVLWVMITPSKYWFLTSSEARHGPWRPRPDCDATHSLCL